MSCKDPARPYCDLAGDYPASDGVARTCIPSPFDAGMGGAGDGGSGSSADAGGDVKDAGAQTDAASPCEWAPLSRLANVNSSAYETAGSLDSNGLALLFERSGNDVTDTFFVASREDIGGAFGAPRSIDEVSGDGKTDPEISSSSLEFFYRLTSGDIQSATRGSLTGTFGPAESTGLEGYSPELSADGLTLYFIGTGDLTVQKATRKAVGEPWGSPTTVLPTGGYVWVDISADELRLLLTVNPFSFPPDPILVAERGSTDEAFGSPSPVNRELLVPDAGAYSAAKWDVSQREMIVTRPAG
jgi:hypothetical protein